MILAWLIVPAGVCVAVAGAWRLAPFYHELAAERLLKRGRDRQAAHHLETACKMSVRRRGPRSLAAAAAQAGLARVRFLQGIPRKGELLLDAALDIVLSHTARTRNPSRNLVRVLIATGRAALAGERYRDAIAAGEHAALAGAGLFTVADPLRGAIEALLGEGYAGLGDFERANELYEDALDTFRLASGEASPEVGSVLASMAASLARAERWREAREAGLEAVEIFDNTDSTRLPDALSALAELHARRGRLVEAEGLRVSICQLWERLGGAESAALAREYERRAELLRSMERTTEAGYLIGKAERIRRAVAATL